MSDFKFKVVNGDSLEVLKELPDNSIHAIVTDPPYGLSNTSPKQVNEAIAKWAAGERDFVPVTKGFMGKDWDAFVPPPALWDECFRVLKPGGHLLAFAGTRTFDLMGLSVRFAGFEIRDGLAWLYGSGMPKGQSVGKMIDKADGFERTENLVPSEKAALWEGWNTALKPAFEPIVFARKPLSEKTVAKNVLKHGTGALNVDSARITADWDNDLSNSRAGYGGRYPANAILGHTEECVEVGSREVKTGIAVNRNRSGEKPNQVYGKWAESGGADQTYGDGGKETIPDWECVYGCPVAAVDEQSGERKAGGKGTEPSKTGQNDIYGTWERVENKPYADTGGASRFFYVAKAAKKERPEIVSEEGKRLVHPTVKPLSLMRWLVRLITPPGGIVLDPFAGSGTTVEAACLEGFSALGIERETGYIDLISVRMGKHQQTIEPGDRLNTEDES